MTRKNWMVGALCAALLPLAALAGDGAMSGHFHAGMRGGDAALLSGVTLSAAQQTQIEQLHQAAWAQAKPLMQQLHSLHSQKEALLFAAGSVNTASLTALHQQESALRTQLEDLRLNTTLQVRSVLTADQLATAAATHAQMESLHQQMHSLTHPGAASSTAQ